MKTILIVDDNQDVLESLRHLVLSFGYRAVAKKDGLAALRVLKQGEPVDLVITDYQMPGMDGLELLAAVKRTAPSVPVIVMSAFSSADVYLTARTLGAAEFLEKPLNLREMRRAIEDIFTEAATGQERGGR